METQCYQGRFVDPQQLGIKPITSLELIEVNPNPDSPFSVTDSQQSPEIETTIKLLDLTPCHQSIEIPSFQITDQRQQFQNDQFQFVNSSQELYLAQPSIEYILIENLRKEEMENITAKFIYKIDDILKQQPQFCSIQIKTNDFTNQLQPLYSSTSIEKEQKESPIMINIDPGSFKSIPVEKQPSKGIEKTQESEGQDDLQIRNQLKQENIKLERVLSFLTKRSKGQPTNLTDEQIDLSTLKAFLLKIDK